MKKFISLLLTFCMFFTMSMSAFAAPVEENVVRTARGTYYTYSEPYDGDVWEIIVYHPNNADVMEFTTRAHNSPMIYSTEISGNNPQNLDIQNVLEDISLRRVEVRSMNSQECIQNSTPSRRTAVEGSMKRALRSEYGNEYSGKVLATYNNSYFPNVSRIQIKEDMFFRFDPDNPLKRFFKAGSTVAEIAMAIFKVPTDEDVEAVITLLGGANALLEDTSIEKHTAIVNLGRYAYINGGSTIYNNTYKFYNHDALDMEGVDEVVLVDPEIRYSDSASYFNSYYQQATDAYNAYL